MSQSAGRRYRRMSESVDGVLTLEVSHAISRALAGQGVMAGETLPAMIKRVCPEVLDLGSSHGVTVVFDLKENTHRALCSSRMFFVLRRSKRLN